MQPVFLSLITSSEAVFPTTWREKYWNRSSAHRCSPTPAVTESSSNILCSYPPYGWTGPDRTDFASQSGALWTPCLKRLTPLVPIVDPVSVLGLLSQPSPRIIQPGVTSYLCCGDHRLPPTEVSPLGFKFHLRQKQ
ncbi:hypothetical protein AMECASPLE_019266 [Ameca splendens]|uniref:Uncharacterized protein n=1 Tax=Ameca splendens TaxID=208324 RepID=A0ABV0ZBS6_9TELE